MAEIETFKDMMQFIAPHEGGYVNDPLGGDTYYGVTQRAYNDALTAMGLAPMNIVDIQNFEVEAIFYWKYWLTAKCNFLPPKTAGVHFNMSINAGPVEAIILLQQALKISPATGHFGKLTMAAVQASDDVLTAKNYITKVKNFYGVLKTHGGDYAKDYQGWINRTNDLAAWLGLNK